MLSVKYFCFSNVMWGGYLSVWLRQWMQQRPRPYCLFPFFFFFFPHFLCVDGHLISVTQLLLTLCMHVSHTFPWLTGQPKGLHKRECCMDKTWRSGRCAECCTHGEAEQPGLHSLAGSSAWALYVMRPLDLPAAVQLHCSVLRAEVFLTRRPSASSECVYIPSNSGT